MSAKHIFYGLIGLMFLIAAVVSSASNYKMQMPVPSEARHDVATDSPTMTPSISPTVAATPSPTSSQTPEPELPNQTPKATPTVHN